MEVLEDRRLLATLQFPNGAFVRVEGNRGTHHGSAEVDLAQPAGDPWMETQFVLWSLNANNAISGSYTSRPYPDGVPDDFALASAMGVPAQQVRSALFYDQVLHASTIYGPSRGIDSWDGSVSTRVGPEGTDSGWTIHVAPDEGDRPEDEFLLRVNLAPVVELPADSLAIRNRVSSTYQITVSSGTASFTTSHVDNPNGTTGTITARVGDTIHVSFRFDVAIPYPSSFPPMDPQHPYQGPTLFQDYFRLNLNLGLLSIPDLEVTSFQRAADGGADLSYSLRGSSLDYFEASGALPTIGLYWARGTTFWDRISNTPVATASVGTALGAHGPVHFTRDQIGSPPPGATHLVAFLDQRFQVPEAREDNNSAALPLPAEVDLQVTTSFDADGGDGAFGPFLPGVSLPTRFDITATDPANLITRVEFAIAGGGSGPATKTGAHSWTFTRNMGDLSAGPHDLTIRAYDASNRELKKITRTIAVGGQPDFELKVATGSAAREPEELRFLSGVATPVELHGVIEGLPWFYGNVVSLTLAGRSIPVVVEGTGDRLTFVVPYDGANLHAGANEAAISLGSKALSAFGDAPETINAVAVPGWASGAQPVFLNGAYRFENVELSPLDWNGPVPTIDPGIPGASWLNDQLSQYTSSASLKAVLGATAPLSRLEPAVWTGGSLEASFTLLGTPIWQRQYAGLAVGGGLDSTTLEINSLSLAAQEDLGSVTFVDQTFVLPLIKSPPIAELRLELALQVSGSMTVAAGLGLSRGESGLNWVDTYLQLNPKLQATVSGGGNATFLGNLVEVYVRVIGTAQVALGGRIDVQGGLGSSEMIASLNGTLSGSYGWEVGAKARTARGHMPPREFTSREMTPFGPIQLFATGGALRATSVAPSPTRRALTTAQARPVLAEALAFWRAQGADTSRLGTIDVVIADLGGDLIGRASGSTITLDDNAAGWGWSMGHPRRRGRKANPGRMDLLSALVHEVGHLLGHDHDAHGVMAETLEPGVALPGGARTDRRLSHVGNH